MKVRSITSHILRAPLGAQKFYSSQAAFPERNSCLVRIETDAGLVGWGEGGQYGPPEPVAAIVDAVFAPLLIGRDPTEPVRIWEEHYAFSRDFGRKGTYVEAISAIDIALWDISGQAAGLPVWKLLGGRFRDSVTAYATGCYYPDNFRDMPAVLRALNKEASGYAGAGFQFLKIKVGLLGLADDIERLRVIRTAVGPRIGLLVDANHAYNAASAVRMGRLMEPYQIEFFEEPVTPEDRDGYRKVRSENPIAVAGGECEFTRYGFRDLIGGGPRRHRLARSCLRRRVFGLARHPGAREELWRRDDPSCLGIGRGGRRGAPCDRLHSAVPAYGQSASPAPASRSSNSTASTIRSATICSPNPSRSRTDVSRFPIVRGLG